MMNGTLLQDVRKRLHETPELAWNEIATQRILQDVITEITDGDERFSLSLPYKTAVLVEYRNADAEEPFVLVRADMDALPVSEPTSHPVYSKRPGLMHACGHDIHMTVLVGLIDKVARSELKKNILFLFQPAEEGGGGAKALLDAGVFDSFSISRAFALHVTDDYPLGTVASNDAIFMAVPKECDIIFEGKAAHAAMPHKGNDAIAAATAFLSTVHTNLVRSMNPMHLFLFHSGRIHGGRARNIVADRCVIESTVRALSSEHLETGMDIITDTAKSVAQSYGCSVHIHTRGEYIETVNTPACFTVLQKAASQCGVEVRKVFPLMTGEDFGYFTRAFGGLMFWLGSAEKGRHAVPLHSEEFFPSFAVVPYGISVLFGIIAS